MKTCEQSEHIPRGSGGRCWPPWFRQTVSVRELLIGSEATVKIVVLGVLSTGFPVFLFYVLCLENHKSLYPQRNHRSMGEKKIVSGGEKDRQWGRKRSSVGEKKIVRVEARY